MKKRSKWIAIILAIILFLQGVIPYDNYPLQTQKVYADTNQDTEAPTKPTNVTATSINSDSITLTWVAATDNVDVVSYDVYGNNKILNTTGTSITFTGLEQGVTYTFMVTAKDAVGNTSTSSDSLEVTTTFDSEVTIGSEIVDNEVPTAPTNLTISVITGSSISMSWDVATDNVGVDKYEIYCNGNMVGTTTAANYTYVGLEEGTAYCFFIKAYDLVGNESEKSNVVYVTTKVADKQSQIKTEANVVVATGSAISLTENETIDDQAPTAPVNLTVVATTGSAISLVWDVATDNVGVDQYEVYCNGNYVGTTTMTSYTYVGAEQGITYNFYVKASDAAKNESGQSNIVEAILDEEQDNQAPSAPSKLVAVATGSAISLSWDVSTDNVEVTGYKIYRDDIEIGTTINKNYIDKSIIIGSTYTYMVKAYDVSGNLSDASDRLYVTAKDTEAPTAPINLTFTEKTCTTVTLSWDVSVDNTNVVEYDIYKGTTLIGTTKGENIYVSTKLEQCMDYTFTVKAKDEAGNVSEDSNIVNVTTLPEKPLNLNAVTGEDGITIKWDKVDRVDGYELSINGKIIDVGNVTTYLLTQVFPNDKYEFKVRAKKGSDRSVWSDTKEILTAPRMVSNLQTKVVNESTIQLTWDAVEGALAYEVEINGTVVGEVTENKYIHSNISTTNVNNYRVRAINGELKGTWSVSVLKASQFVIKDGTISKNTVWDGSNGIYIVNGRVTIMPGATLQVMPGTIVKLNTNIDINVYGKLIAQGTTENPIIFTAMKDAEYGGSGITKSYDEWSGIHVGSTGEFIGDNVKIKYGGYYGNNNNYSALNIDGILNLNNSEIRESYQDGIRIGSEKDVIIQNTTIDGSSGNNISIKKNSVNTGTVTLRKNIIQNGLSNGIAVDNAGKSGLIVENNTIKGNAKNGIEVSKHDTGIYNISENNITNNGSYPVSINLGGIESSVVFPGISNNTFSQNKVANLISLCGCLGKDVTIPNDKYIVEYITISSGTTLTIQPGTILLSYQLNGSITVNGKLLALGTLENPIVFTSLKDAKYGGSGVTKTYDEWIGIYVGSTGTFIGDNVKIKYGGYYNPGYYSRANFSALNVYGILDLNNSEISESNQDGIRISSGKDVIIQNTTIDGSSGNNISIYKSGVNTGTVTLKKNVIRNGACIGINVRDAGESGLIVENNTIEGNAEEGIVVYDVGNSGCIVETNTIVDNGTSGIKVSAHDIGTFRISGNNITNNAKYPICIDLGGIDSTVVLSSISNNTFSENKVANLIELSGNLYKDIIIPNNKYAIEDITIPSGITLTIQPGAIFMFIQNYGVLYVNGKLDALGTKENPIVFTSSKDNKYGGSGITTANDGWRGISVGSTGEFNGNNIKIKYGGYYSGSGYSLYNYSALNVYGTLILYNSEISNSNRYGIFLNTAIQPTIIANSFKDNNDYGIYNSNSNIVINAEYNYWNSIYGPSIYMQVYNPSSKTWTWKWVGSGDKVGSNVNYSPYLGTEMVIDLHFNQIQGTYAPTGNYSKQYTDMNVNCLEDTLTFTRSYNSKDTDTSVFGKGWSFNYESNITDYKDLDNIKLVKLPDGSQESYTVNTDGTFTANYSRNTLIKKADGTYILTITDQTQYGYNTDGILIWIESKEGNRLIINLNSDGKPKNMIDYVGREYSFTYENNLLKTITDSQGRMVRYVYDGNKLVKVIDPEGIEINYAYDANGYLSEIRDGNNDVTESVTYITSNESPKVEHVTDAYGNTKTYTYDEANSKTTITDNNGNTTTEFYDTSYNITNVIDAEGQITSAIYSTVNGVNKYSEVVSETDRNGNTTTYNRDSNGKITKMTNSDTSYKQYTYDEKNNLTSERDEGGNYTYYIYDSTNTYLLKVVQPLNRTDTYSTSVDQSKFAIKTYTYYQAGENGYTIKGLIKSITDPEGNTITYTYDAYGNALTTTDSISNTTTNTYNTNGLVTSTLTPKGELTTYTYDQNGNPKTMVQDGGETTQINYDGLGRKIQEITPNIYKITPTGNVGTRYSYYKSGKVHTMTDSEDNITAYTYDLYGNTLSETLPNGGIYTYTYDVMNRLAKVYFQDTKESKMELLKEYTYTILDDKKTQTTETVYLNATETATTIYVYDYAERLVKQTNPDGGILTTIYNANGTVYSSTDAMGKTTYYKYDGLNRLTEQWKPFGNSKYTYMTVTYDNNGNKTAEKIGVESVSLWGIPSNLITTCYDYGINNLLEKVTDSANGKTEYVYDENGKKIKETIYLGLKETKVTEYEYNHLGKVKKMSQHVEARDIYGNAANDTTDKILVTHYTYDANGNVKTMTTPDNITTTYEYDTLNRVITQKVTGIDEYGKSTTIITSVTYDYAGNVLTTIDGNGEITQNIYNKKGLLEQTIDPEKGKTSYYYDNAGRMIAKVLPENYSEGVELSKMSRMVFNYDNMNRIILEQDIYYDDEAKTFKTINSKANQYDYNGNVIKSLDALGYESGAGTTRAEKISSGYGTINTYNDANLLLTTLSPVSKESGLTYDVKYTYDATGKKTSETNANNVITKYYYDNAGRLVKTTVVDTTEKVIHKNTYDGMGNVLAQTDGNGNTTTFTYNRLGLLRSQKESGDATIDSYMISNQYNALGQLVYQKDSMGKEILITYNHDGKVLSKTEQKEDGTQSITTFNSYDKNGNLRFTTDANGVKTENDYDGLNQVIHKKITVTGVEHVTINTYDKNGNQLTTTDWLGNTYTNKYDALNRLIKKTDPYGNIIEKYEYNNNHAQTKAYDACGNITTFEYDKNNRLISSTNPLGHVTSQTYDNVGNIATKKDSNNNVTKYSYDVFNHLTKVTNAKSEVTNYTYDLNGNMLTQEDAKGFTITYNYNAANILIEKTEPGYAPDTGKTDYYTYYADGKVKTRTDKNGHTTTYTYDIHGNLMSESIGSSVITYTYDANGNKLTITDSTGTTSRTYDELGRVLTKTTANVGTISYEYDITTDVEKGHNKEKSTDPKGNITVKVYDKVGRLSKVIDGDDVTTYTYYDNGNRKSITYSDGSKEEYTYYANNQVETLINTKSDGNILDSYSYTYDKAGNQLTKYESINGKEKGTTSYTYDNLNHLQTVTEPNGRVTTYAYDEVGNRSKETIVITDTTTNSTITTENEYVYDNQNRLTSITKKVNNKITEVTNYTYDNNGNQLTTVVDSYINGVVTSSINKYSNTYDMYNQLIHTVTENGTVVNSIYNAEGYRVGKEVVKANEEKGTTTYYLYEGDKIILEVDDKGKQVARNVYGMNLLRRAVEGETYSYLYNGHADVTALINKDGTVAATYYYDAFGNILESTGNVNNNIRYAGYQYDEETGLYYLNARMYDPVTARFLQEDTYTGNPNDPLSLNLYTYCNNNPIIYQDPTGHFIISAIVIGAIAGAVIGGTVEYVSQKYIQKKKKVNWKAVGYEAVVGGVFGAIGGVTGGTVAGVAGKATAKQIAKKITKTGATAILGGFATDVGRQAIVDGKKLKNINYKTSLETGLISGASDIAGYAFAPIVKKAKNAIKTKAISFVDTVFNNVTNKADDYSDGQIKMNLQFFAKGGSQADFYVKPNGDVIPATGYRYMDSKYAEQTKSSMSAPGSYVGFEKFDSALAAQDAFQVAPEWSNCKLRGEFDTLQAIDDMYVPKAFGDKGPGLEPFTECYPQYGTGGQQQFIYKGTIQFKNVDIIGD